MQPNLRRIVVTAVAVAGFLTLAPRASADQLITLQYLGNDGGDATVQFKGAPLQDRLLGTFKWKDTDPDDPTPGFPSTIKTFCIELEQGLPSLTPPTATFKITDPAAAPTLNAAKADAIRALYGKFYDAAAGTVTNGATDRGFQMALWELVYDLGNLNLASGQFAYLPPSPVTSPTYQNAQMILNALSGSGMNDGLNAFNNSGYELVALVAPAGPGAKTQDEVQDQITVRPKGVPAPPAALLAGIGALALLGRARWTRKAPVAAV